MIFLNLKVPDHLIQQPKTIHTIPKYVQIIGIGDIYDIDQSNWYMLDIDLGGVEMWTELIFAQIDII